MSMMLVVWLTSVVLAMLLLAVLTRLGRFEKTGSELAAALLLASFPFLFTTKIHWYMMAVLAVLHVWLLVLPARLLMGRLEKSFLRRSTEYNAYAGAAAVVVLTFLELSGYLPQYGQIGLTVVASAALGVLFIFFGQLLWNTRHYHLDKPEVELSNKDLPTVSLCIPARNEDHTLTECLQAAIASDYPKLEILVLDDCSQDTTSQIIRSFAHDGVRFVQGAAPSGGWLGKTQALQTLAEHASGDYIIFAGVHTQVAPQTISQLVRYTLAHNLQMVSVLPQNRLGVKLPTLLPTMDYFWRMVWPITRRHVPVSSKFWLIKSLSLKQLGGFASVSHKIVPEESFARRLFSMHSYHFVMAHKTMGLTTAKKWRGQVDTTLRLLHPLARRQPLLVLLMMLSIVALSNAPLLGLVILAATGVHNTLMWVCLACVVLFTLNYGLVIGRTQPRNWLLAMFLWPLAVSQELALMIVSMLQYEFGEVNWKGRNVCYPVLGLPQPLPPEPERPVRVSVSGQPGQSK
jgi:hypothetical protein